VNAAKSGIPQTGRFTETTHFSPASTPIEESTTAPWLRDNKKKGGVSVIEQIEEGIP
jgi:hypothetical protein